MEKKLHQDFIAEITPEMSFEEVYEKFNQKIKDLGYENLDFNRNLGHTIETQKEDRIFFEAGEKTLLKDVGYFTFEPHIKKTNGEYGFKKENIYYFEEGEVKGL